MAGIIGVWQLVNAATTWQGPPTNCTYPGQTNCNTDGVVWNRSDTNFNTLPAQIGNFKISGNGAIGNDFYIPDTKAFRVDKSGDSIIRIGNWGGTGNHQSDLVIYGDLKVEQRTDSMTIPQIQTPWLCLNGDCRNVWPSGGGGGGTVTSVGSGNGLTGGPITGSGTLSIMTCANGQILKVSGGVWACGADIDTNSGGTLTGVTPGNGISVSGGAPSPTVSINDSYGFGCANGQVRKWNGASWVCSGDATATVGAGTGIIITGTAPNYTVNVDDNRYVNVTGDNMTGKLGISAAIFGTTFEAINNLYTNQWHWGGTFTANGALGVGVSAEGDLYGVQATGDSYGIYADTDVAAGYGGFFTNNIYGNSVYLGGQSYGVYSNGPIYSVGKITGAGDVQGNRLCIGTDCRAAWPSAGTGDMTGVTAGSGLTGGGLSGDVTVNVGAGNGVSVSADTVSVMSCTSGQVLKTNASNLWYCGTDIDTNSGGDITGVTAGTNMTGGGTTGSVTLNVTDNWVNTTGDTMTGNLKTSGIFGSSIAYMLNNDTDSYFTGGTLTGFARYGMIYESNVLSMAIPDGGVNNNEFQVNKYYPTGTKTTLLAIRSDDGNAYLTSGNLNVKSNGIPSTGASALLVNGAEALWYNGTYFSWGYGASYNFFADPVYFGSAYSVPTYRIQLPNTATNSGGRAQANLWATYSDTRVKFNQKKLMYGLKELMALEPKSYEQHSSKFDNGQLKILPDSENTIGFIAQEVYKIVPEAVMKPVNEDQELWGMSYEKLTPVIIKGIQEQQIEINELRIQNQELEARIQRMESILRFVK